jgi:hypothetical protein
VLLQRHAIESPAHFAASVRRPAEAVAAALEAVAGSDAHDWFPNLATSLNIEESAVVQAATECWLATDEGAKHAQSFVRQVTTALSS